MLSLASCNVWVIGCWHHSIALINNHQLFFFLQVGVVLTPLFELRRNQIEGRSLILLSPSRFSSPRGLTVGVRNSYLLSKCQIVKWFFPKIRSSVLIRVGLMWVAHMYKAWTVPTPCVTCILSSCNTSLTEECFLLLFYADSTSSELHKM